MIILLINDWQIIGFLLSQLFRSEALSHRTNHYHGEVLIRQPIAFSWLTAAVMAVIVGFLLLLLLGVYTRKETVVGYLSPNKGVIKVYALVSGVVKELSIHNGEKVTVDQTLFNITTDIRINDRDISFNQQLLEQLLLSQELVNQKVISESEMYNQELENLENLVSNLSQEISQIDKQLNTQATQLSLAEKEVEKLERLFNDKMISQDNLMNATFRFLNMKSLRESTEQLKTSKTEQLYRVKNQAAQLPAKQQIRLTELANEKAVLDRRILELKASQFYAIKSPVEGTIASVLANVGQVVDSSKPLLSILPEDSELYAELLLPSRSIGFVEKGQSVLLRFDAFPYQRYGLYRGVVEDVSGTALSPHELSMASLSNTNPVYIVKVQLDQQHISAYGQHFKLQSGMQVSADIILDKRSLAEWLIDPILSLRGGI